MRCCLLGGVASHPYLDRHLSARDSRRSKPWPVCRQRARAPPRRGAGTVLYPPDTGDARFSAGAPPQRSPARSRADRCLTRRRGARPPAARAGRSAPEPARGAGAAVLPAHDPGGPAPIRPSKRPGSRLFCSRSRRTRFLANATRCGQLAGTITCRSRCGRILWNARCGGTCVNVNFDVKNCGDCGKVCPSGTGGIAGCTGGSPGRWCPVINKMTRSPADSACSSAISIACQARSRTRRRGSRSCRRS